MNDSVTGNKQQAYQAPAFKAFTWCQRGERVLKTQPLAVQISPRQAVHSTDKAGDIPHTPHFPLQWKDPDPSPVGSEIQKSGGVPEGH